MARWSTMTRSANVIALVSLAGIFVVGYFVPADGALWFWIMLGLFAVFCVAVLVRVLRGVLQDLGATRE